MKKTWMHIAVVGGLAMLAASALAADKTLALVVKGLDNPYFDLMHQGCERANTELHKEGFNCYYTGPATAADESAEVQIIDDLLTKGVSAIAISPSNSLSSLPTPTCCRRMRRCARPMSEPTITN